MAKLKKKLKRLSRDTKKSLDLLAEVPRVLSSLWGSDYHDRSTVGVSVGMIPPELAAAGSPWPHGALSRPVLESS